MRMLKNGTNKFVLRMQKKISTLEVMKDNKYSYVIHVLHFQCYVFVKVNPIIVAE